MTLRRRVLDYTLAGFLLLVPLLILHSSLKQPEDLNRFDHAVLRVSSPLQSAVSWLVEGLGGIWHRYVWLVDVEDENGRLRDDNARLRLELGEARRMQGETAALEELIGLRQRIIADTVGARVVAASMTAAFRVVRVSIDRGEHEVEPGMPVLNADGLVGRVLRSYGKNSDVLLLTDPDSNVPVTISRTKALGSLTGLADGNRYRCEIAHLEGEVQVGDEVVTSGLSGDFPPGLVVGKVSKVTRIEYELFQVVEVEPAVNFSDLDRLLVLVARPPPDDPDGETRKRAPPAVGVRPY